MIAESTITRLSVLALPSRTSLLFFLIIVAVALPVAVSLGSGLPVCAPCLVFCILVLPFAVFLQRPAFELAQCQVVDVGLRYPYLAHRWKELAATVAKTRLPCLALTRHDRAELYAFGTFTRRYVALSDSVATEIEARLESDDENERRRGDAVLLHELAHFVHHDVWMAFFASSLLWVTIAIGTLDYVADAFLPLLHSIVLPLYDSIRRASPELIQTISALNLQIVQNLLGPPFAAPILFVRYEVFVFTAHLPLILGSFVLLLFYWRALVRTRELYADARVAEWQGSAQPLKDGLALVQVIQALSPPRIKWRGRFQSWRVRLQEIDFLFWNKTAEWLDANPSLAHRREVLRQPYKIYGRDWVIGLSAGGIVVLLNFMLGSLFLSRYLHGPTTAVPFIIGFVVLSLSLLPFLCQFPQRRREYLTKVVRVVLTFTTIKLIPQYMLSLIITLGTFINPHIIDQSAYVLVLGAGESSPPLNVSLNFALGALVIRPAVLFTVAMPVVLIGLVMVDAEIKRRVLRWYGARYVDHHPASVFLGVTVLLATLMGLLLLPVLDAITVATAHDLSDPFVLSLIGFAVGGLVCAMVLFFFCDRRYVDRCARCGARVEGEYWLGRSCSTCGQLFHPRLCG